MRRLLTRIIVLCCVSGFQIAQSQNQGSGHHAHLYQHSRKTLSLPSPKSIELHAAIGKLPEKYVRLTKQDEIATSKVGSMFKDALQAAFPDTYTVKQYGPIDIDLPGTWIRGQLYLNNLVVRGIHQIVLRHLEVRTKNKNKRIDFTAFAPSISANMNFEVDGHKEYAPAYLKGTISLSEQDLNPSGAISVKKQKFHPHGDRYQVVAGDVSGKIQNINITIEDTDVEEDLNFLKEQVIEETKDKIAALIMGTVFKQVNKLLKEIPAADAYKFLTEND